MSNMKCPICGQELKNINLMWFCENESCRAYDWTMEESAWQELIKLREENERTRKALDVAVDALESAHDYYEYCIQRDKDCDSDDINWDCTAMNMDNDINDALEQITALEQKDK